MHEGKSIPAGWPAVSEPPRGPPSRSWRTRVWSAEQEEDYELKQKDVPYLHEEDLADIAVLTDQVKQTVAVHLAHGQVMDNHHAAPGGRT